MIESKTLKELLQPYKEIDDYLTKVVWGALKKEYPEDFKNIELKYKRPDESWIQVEKLKREAIKWYKEALKQNKGVPKNAITTSDWLEFFNIKDEDLKDAK